MPVQPERVPVPYITLLSVLSLHGQEEINDNDLVEEVNMCEYVCVARHMRVQRQPAPELQKPLRPLKCEAAFTEPCRSRAGEWLHEMESKNQETRALKL